MRRLSRLLGYKSLIYLESKAMNRYGSGSPGPLSLPDLRDLHELDMVHNDSY